MGTGFPVSEKQRDETRAKHEAKHSHPKGCWNCPRKDRLN